MNKYILILVLLVSPWSAAAQKLETTKTAALNRTISEYVARQGIPGLSAAVSLKGRVVWSNGYGYSDLENSVRATADTVYRSASIGKALTATAAMRLVELGKLD